jgi:hypothetical protein
MRIVLLLSVTCMGYAMENQAINETRPLIGPHQENTIQSTVQHCCDYHGGKLLLCGVLTCIGGLAGAGCWHAGGIEAAKAASAIAQVMQ